MTNSDVRWACTAQLDLLGFSNHLAVTKWDIRTQTGVQAIERLSSLEDAIRLFEKERIDYPDLYPSGLQYIRFNDALFLGIDVEYLEPPPGQTTLTGGCSLDQLRKIVNQKAQGDTKGTVIESGGDVARLLGLVARIHDYVNRRERERSFPGCRTVVASGLRKRFADRKGADDFFSANLSASIAFEAEQKGKSVGLSDNNLYVEDDVATGISYCESCHAILGFAKFIRSDSSIVNPYSYQRVQEDRITLPLASYSIAEPILLEVLKKRLTFRRLDPGVLTNLQLFEDYQRVSRDPREEDRVEKELRDSLVDSTPTLDEVNKSHWSMNYPFLSLRFSLDDDYSKFFLRNDETPG